MNFSKCIFEKHPETVGHGRDGDGDGDGDGEGIDGVEIKLRACLSR